MKKTLLVLSLLLANPAFSAEEYENFSLDIAIYKDGKLDVSKGGSAMKAFMFFVDNGNPSSFSVGEAIPGVNRECRDGVSKTGIKQVFDGMNTKASYKDGFYTVQVARYVAVNADIPSNLDKLPCVRFSPESKAVFAQNLSIPKGFGKEMRVEIGAGYEIRLREGSNQVLIISEK